MTILSIIHCTRMVIVLVWFYVSTLLCIYHIEVCLYHCLLYHCVCLYLCLCTLVLVAYCCTKRYFLNIYEKTILPSGHRVKSRHRQDLPVVGALDPISIYASLVVLLQGVIIPQPPWVRTRILPSYPFFSSISICSQLHHCELPDLLDVGLSLVAYALTVV